MLTSKVEKHPRFGENHWKQKFSQSDLKIYSNTKNTQKLYLNTKI